MKNYKTYITEKKRDLTSQWWEAVTILDLNDIKKLVELGVDINDTFTVSDYTALISICEKNDDEIAEYLIQQGADLNRQNIYGYTALMSTTDHNIAELLIKAGADMTLTNDVDNTFIDISIGKFANGKIKEWLNTEDAQRLILSKNPLMYKEFLKVKHHIKLHPKIKKEFAFAKTGDELNLL